MHFRSLLFVELPKIEPDPKWEKEVLDQIEAVKAKHPGKVMESALLGLYIGRLNNVKTAFGMELTKVIHEAMEPFYCNTENPEYLEFEDRTEYYKAEFEKNVDCVVMPGGRIMEIDAYPIWRKFIIKDGLVFQKEAGQLHHPKRTKKAKKMKALPNYPRKKLYKSFEDFVEYEGGSKDEETGKYGEWFNPNSVYDWYSIGGRWPAMFLVKLDCMEFSYGERESMDDQDYPAPEGYRWVACARKKDIQWDAMRQWRNQKAEEGYHKLVAMFNTGETDEFRYRIAEDGIYHWGELLYKKGQTLEEYMAKHGIPESWKYPLSIFGIFIDDCYHSEYDSVYDEEQKKWVPRDWQQVMDAHIDDADDDTVFVGIDYHM